MNCSRPPANPFLASSPRMPQDSGPRRHASRSPLSPRSSRLPLRCTLLWGLLLLSATVGCLRPDSRPYPSKPLTIICPWAAGGGTDRIARFWAESLQRELGKPVVVANKTGGAGAVGHRSGAQAKPDGYTLTMITFELSTMHHMGIAELTHEDFTCLLQVNADPAAIVVRKDAPWNSLREFLDDAQARPGELKMSGTARGGAWDLARAGLLLADGQPVENILWIPTQGSAPSLVELLGGHIEAVCCSVPEAIASLDELKILAVMSDERLSEYPEVPTAREAGVEWSAVGWRGLAVPLETPTEAVERLQEACAAIARSEEYRAFMEKNSFALTIREKEEFVEFLTEQDRQWQQVIHEAGFAAVEE